MSISPNYCSACKIDSFNRTGKAVVKYRELEASAASQCCKACVLLTAGLRTINVSSASEIAEITLYDSLSGTRFYLGFADGTISSKFELFSPQASSESATSCEDPSICDSRKIYGSEIGELRPFVNDAPVISGDTSSPKAIQWTKDMFQACLSGHRHCLHGYKDTPLPTMVLDLDIPDPGSAAWKQDLKLYRSHAESTPYVCLSHCWGQSGWVKTTTSNLNEYLNTIAFDALPKTYQDAIIFTRALGFRYLWIDSLCIVQDDLEDWRRESVNMCSIYHGAALTLAASMAANNASGCFNKRVSSNGRGHKLAVAHPDYVESKVYVRECIDHNDVIKMAPLLTRAWAYQEHLLSPRYLHFGNKELLWECAEGISCECGFCESKGGRMTYSSYVHANTLPERPLQPASANPVSSLRHWWHTLVSRYSALSLTIPSDRLPAISGLAKHLQWLYGPEYLAGLWEETILRDLLWYSHDPTNRPKDWRAPTWSWASIEGPVGFISLQNNNTSEQCTLVQGECTSLGPDSFGEISSGHIILSGHLVSARLRISRTGDSGTSGVEMKRTLEIERPGSPSPCLIFETDFDVLWPVKQGSVHDQSVFYLGIASTDLMQYGLVLNCVDAATDTFERIGLATLRRSEIMNLGELTVLRIV